jgi:HEPN domain-containing protein
MALYEPTDQLFGSDVATKFSSLTYDIAEAGKCLALERSTASVFHSVRCLEAGIRALSRCLGIPDPTHGSERTWGRLLETLKAAIDEKWPPKNLSARSSQDGRLFERAYAALAAMMNPWRNETMHLAEKYTESEARHIFEVIKGFMGVVASRCDENGEPRA